MNFLSLVGVELKKIRRSGILPVLLAAAVILWMPSVFNAQMNLAMRPEGITPEHNFFIQGFLGMSWFMYPACMVVCTVLLTQTERTNNGILKMLSLPVGTTELCLAKFAVLLILAAVQVLMHTGMYYISAFSASQAQNYDFLVTPLLVWKTAGTVYLTSIPLLAVYWMLSACIHTPIFTIGTGLASIVPAVLMINTKVWFLYPICYPFYIVTAEYGKLSTHFSGSGPELVPWLPVALAVTVLCMAAACLRFGQAERR